MKKVILSRRLMLGGVSFALVLSGTVNVSQGQKINRKRPSVYITFGKFVKKTGDVAYPSEGSRLILHNNTRWPIYYGDLLHSTLPGDVAMSYIIELEDGRRDVRNCVDVVTTGKLMPGKTLSFVVPRRDFPRGSEIYVEFTFSWELSKGERVQ